ncbi:hypothetical protein C1141_16045 [Vibrio agarivorans]|uniref:Uncharacterized protein n=2 Tax=Vibrio sagamiensis TaxID=512650 RepID=A0A511QK01_9VIBR|nr:hypothetical protein C1141_16045 [Vibrio agarivorans]GEM77643.1 hypothetical protein VSA01S_37550 [Vibrio sagamiensis NBRC 104589]
MMMNYIQKNNRNIPWFTSLIDVFSWLEIEAKDYDWHFSDVDGGWDELDDPSWVEGEELARRLCEYNYQFVWSVISAYPKGTSPFTSEKPYADGNSDFWSGIPKKQLENSLFEIVCWDSSATLFIGMPDELQKSLLKNAPGIRDLNKENERRKC